MRIARLASGRNLMHKIPVLAVMLRYLVQQVTSAASGKSVPIKEAQNGRLLNIIWWAKIRLAG